MAGLVIGALGSWVYFRWRVARMEAAGRERRDREEREARMRLREKESELELAHRQRMDELERENARRENEVGRREEDVKRDWGRLKDKEAVLEEREEQVRRARRELEKAEHEAVKSRRLYRLKAYQVAGMSREEARERVLAIAENECRQELAAKREQLLGRSEAEIAEKARGILLAAMQRITSNPMSDVTATLVRLPNEEMKGRIIGREGRNIRTFEHATGTTLMIDETPDSVLVSCFDPVRREIARLTLEALLRDGRIHPASIEEEAGKARKEMAANVAELGEGALRRLKIHNLPPELVRLVGQLHYHLSNNQNTLEHSVEVANLCSLLASEIGLDARIAKRAGLLHDVGKALDEDHEGSHATAGANLLKRYGEDPDVVNAAAAHHEEVPAESPFAALVMVADRLSATRPGARASSEEGFMQRVRSIEEIARAEGGVEDAYALQAGRELRIIVHPGTVGEEEAKRLARRVRQRIEAELNYPGTIEITVIRERRFTETAV